LNSARDTATLARISRGPLSRTPGWPHDNNQNGTLIATLTMADTIAAKNTTKTKSPALIAP